MESSRTPQHSLVLTPADLDNSESDGVLELKRKNWLARSSRSGSGSIENDWKRGKIGFSVDDQVITSIQANDEESKAHLLVQVKEKFFGENNALLEQFEKAYSQELFSSMNTILFGVLSPMTTVKDGSPPRTEKGQIIFEKKGNEVFATVTQPIEYRTCDHSAFDTCNDWRFLPGSIQGVFKLEPGTGFQLQHIQTSNQLVKQLIMGEKPPFDLDINIYDVIRGIHEKPGKTSSFKSTFKELLEKYKDDKKMINILFYLLFNSIKGKELKKNILQILNIDDKNKSQFYNILKQEIMTYIAQDKTKDLRKFLVQAAFALNDSKLKVDSNELQLISDLLKNQDIFKAPESLVPSQTSKPS